MLAMRTWVIASLLALGCGTQSATNDAGFVDAQFECGIAFVCDQASQFCDIHSGSDVIDASTAPQPYCESLPAQCSGAGTCACLADAGRIYCSDSQTQKACTQAGSAVTVHNEICGFH
jgi:hypothetical protein